MKNLKNTIKYPYPLCDLTIQDWINLRNNKESENV